MQVKSIMKPLKRFLQPGDDLGTADQMFKEESVSILPVCDQSGTLVGTIDGREVAEALFQSPDSSETALVEVLMSPRLISCLEGDDVMALALKARDEGLSHAMVLDEQGGLIGVAHLTPYQHQREPNAGRQDTTLDNTLEQTFPASDPVPPP